jgi:hypothetical protein
MNEPPRHLFQRWLHSHEEDTGTERVYRPAGFAFPPSRGRTGFELRPDRTCSRIGIAARDGSTEQDCSWEYEENEGRALTLIMGAGDRQTLQVVSVSGDRLVVKK